VKGHFSDIELIASLMSQLNRYQPSLVVALVDTLLEDMHENLLTGQAASQQRRLAHVRLFAECYNHQVIRSQLLFYALYMTISLGTNTGCFYLFYHCLGAAMCSMLCT
jgi:hypothetical protein